MPSWDHTGTPLHFHSSTTSGSACLMRARTWESVLPLQSSSSLILASISREGDSPLVVALFFILFAPSFALFFHLVKGTNHPSSAPALHEAGIGSCIPPKSNRRYPQMPTLCNFAN